MDVKTLREVMKRLSLVSAGRKHVLKVMPTRLVEGEISGVEMCIDEVQKMIDEVQNEQAV